MFRHIRITVMAALALLVVGVGIAGADGYGGGQSAKPKQGKDSKRWKAFKSLDTSRLSQVAYMTGGDVVNAAGEDDVGDPDGKGSANFLQVDERTICYGFMVRGVGTPTAAAIYKGEAGKVGPAVVKFANVPKNAAGQPFGNPGASSGCKTTTDPAETAALQRIRKNPKNYYVMFKTDGFAEGAVRGQLGPVWYDNDGR